jgi:hypothetical protein
MFSDWIGKLLSGGLTGILTPWFSHLDNKDKITLDGFKTATGSDEKGYEAYLDYLVKMNSMRVAETSWWGAKLCIMIVAVPACLNVGGVLLDSTVTFFTGHYGVLGIVKPPPDYFAFEQRVIEWLFGAAVVAPGVSAVAAWLHRKS